MADGRELRYRESTFSVSIYNLVRQKSLKWTDRVTKRSRFAFFCAEFLGTATFMFIGCCGCMVETTVYETPDSESVALSFGLAMMVSIMVFAHISYGHFNPTLTVCAMILKVLAVVEVPIYLLGQFLGSFAGFALVKFIQSQKQRTEIRRQTEVGICSPKINHQLHPAQALAVEFMISFVLCFFACVKWDQFRSWRDSLSITLGVVYICLIVSGHYYTGAHMNPARSLAPAVINGDWEDHWLYWAGPLLAAVSAPVLYRLFIPNDVYVGEIPSIKH